ncbi:carbohydrate ABC transporter substrate-binding protein [Vibrio sp. F13]|uniref:ABC transporter substrate-binding protein n=1 Tax=Vibrio sp. F13 TaxID=2070777 RepID=UPI0010BD4DCA|nr:ABC transporter substrate-binding protein [Vibrio sp. F13]TKF54669.1 carbohydrate ABC transporter substrate-binding protein [Vibrio sp. F13]
MKTRPILLLSLLSLSVSSQTLVIDTWGDEANIWQDSIIPAFNQHYPEIEIVIKQLDSWSYIGEQNQRLKDGEAGDLVMCRPFDPSLVWFQKGYLEEITEIEGIENFPSFAQAAWQTDSGAQTFCLPLGSVMHGFFYNKALFHELGLNEPVTEQEFYQQLDAIKQDGRYVPLAFGTKDAWAVSELGLQNIGPNHWQGEDGRTKLILGDMAIDSDAYISAFEALHELSQYMGEGYQQRGYSDSWELFKRGEAVIAPGGSWEIVNIRDSIDLGVFMPPRPDRQSQCYITDHTDKGIGINSASKNIESAHKLLHWMTTAEFAHLLTRAEPGFFPLSNHFIDILDPTANVMASWRTSCDVTIRNFSQILSRGEPSLSDQMSTVSVAVMEGALTASQATKALQDGLNQWYQPQKMATQKLQKLEQCTIAF